MRNFSLVKSLTRVINQYKGLLILCLSLAVFGINDAWGNSDKDYYSQANVSASPTGGGMVYVTYNTESKPSNPQNHAESGKVTTKDDAPTHTYYFWADVNPGYSWNGWTFAKGDPATSSTQSKATSKIKAAENVDNATITATATFTAHKYKVNFYGNGATDGSMNQQELTYDQTSLNANAFSRSYTVSFNADEGSTPDAKTATYTFKNWNTNADGTGTTHNSGDKNLTTENGKTITLYAQWESASITLPSSTKSGAVLDGWYSGDTKIGNPGATYTPTADITLKAKWQEKYTPEISYKGSTSYNVGDGPIDLQTLWTSTGNGAITYSKVIFTAADGQQSGSTEPAITSNRYLSLNKAGTLKIHLEQAGTSTYYGASADVTITISRIANTLTADGSRTMYVDDQWTGVISGKNSDATVTTTTTDNTIAYYDVASNTIVAPNSSAKSFNSTEITITISQAETYKYTFASKTIKVTVNKYDNHIFINKSQDSYTTSMYKDSNIPISLTATNTDYTGSPISVKPDNDVTTINAAKTQVSSNYKLGTTVWTLSQPENYKYKAANASFTVHVIKEAEATDCYVLNEPTEKKFSDIGDNTYVLSGPGDKLTYQLKKYSPLTLDQNPKLQGYNASTGKWEDLDNLSYNTSYSDKSYTITNRNITKLRWTSGGENNYKYVRNVLVTRKTYLEVANVSITKTSSGSDIYSTTTEDNYTGTGNLVINHSLANGGNLKVMWDNPKFTINGKTSAEGVDLGDKGCSTGTTTLPITFASAEVGTFITKVTIYNAVYNDTATITGTTVKRPQSITWNSALTFNTIDKPTLSATSTSGLTNFTYSSDNESIAKVVNGNQLEFYQSGTVTITVNQAGNAYYNAASLLQSITVNKATPTIITSPSTTAVTYGQTLGNPTFTGGKATVTLRGVPNTEVAGSWAWKNPSQVITDAAGSHTYPVVFTPENTAMYNSVEGTATVIVNRADNTITLKDNGTIVSSPVDISYNEGGSKELTIESSHNETGYSVSPTSSNGISAQVSGNKVTFSVAAGNSNRSADFTISQSESSHYNPDSKKITVRVKPIFYFAANAQVGSGSTNKGTVTGTVAAASKEESFGVTGSSTTGTFSASPATGYSFAGWFSSSDCSETAESTATSYTTTITNSSAGSTATKTLYAKFAPNTYIVTLDNQGATTAGANSVTATYDAAVPSIAGKLPAKTGYTFGGYYTAENGGGTKYINADGTSAKNWTETSVTKLYAQWTAKSTTVTLNFNGGCCGAESVTATYGAAMPPATMPQQMGYTFAGYYDATTGGNLYYNADGSSARTWNKDVAEATLYARWTPITYYVTFNGNGSTGGTDMSTQTYTFGVEYTLPANTYEKEYTVTFDANGGSCSTASLAAATTFMGWEDRGSITYNGTTYNYTVFDAPYYANEHGLYNDFGYNKFDLVGHYIYHGNPKYNLTPKDPAGNPGLYPDKATKVASLSTQQGTTTPLYAHWSEASSITLPANGLSRNGYTFQAWYTAATGGTKVGDAGGTYTPTENVTLYAHWTANQYDVTLDPNTGTGGATLVKATYDAALPTVTSLPTKIGYTFAGYYDATTGGTQYIKADGTSAKNWDKTAPATLYAHWTAATYTVTLNANGGTGGATSVQATYGQALPTVTSLPTRTGYTFAGYYDATTGGTQYIKADGTSAKNWDKASTATLYAHWEGKKTTITLQINPSDTDPTKHVDPWPTRTVTATYGSSVLSPALSASDMPTRLGCQCTGFVIPGTSTVVINPDGTLKAGVTDYTDASGNWISTTAVTFYAGWRANWYNLYFNAEGGSCDVASRKARASLPFSTTQDGSGKTLENQNLPNASRPGYTFGGWKTESDYPDGGSKIIKATDAVWTNKDFTVHAQWTANTYQVSFNTNGGGTAPKAIIVTYDQTYGDLPTLTRDGYRFDGWYTAKDGGTQVTSSTKVTITKAQTLYAHWTLAIVWQIENDTEFPLQDIIPFDAVATSPEGAVTYTIKESDRQGWLGFDNTNRTITVGTTTGTLTLVAHVTLNTTGDFTSERTVKLVKREQEIVFNQGFNFITEDDGTIDKIVPLTAYVVDAKTRQPIEGATVTYSVPTGQNVAEIQNGNQLHVKGKGTTTLTASVSATTLYAANNASREIYVHTAGEPCNTMVEDLTGKEKSISNALIGGNPTYTVSLGSVPYASLSFKVRHILTVTSGTMTVEGTTTSGKKVTYATLSASETGTSSRDTTISLRNDTLSSITFSTTATSLWAWTIGDIVARQASYITTDIKGEELIRTYTINTDYVQNFIVSYSDKPAVKVTVTNHNGLEVIRQEDENEGGCGMFGTYHYTLRNTYIWDEPRVVRDTLKITTTIGDVLTYPIELDVQAGSPLFFINAEKDNDWNNLLNWREGTSSSSKIPEVLPRAINNVTINDTVRISQPVDVYGMNITSANPYYGTPGGFIIIEPQGGLTVFNQGVDPQQIANHLVVKSSKEHTGYFRLMPKTFEKWLTSPDIQMQYATKSTLDHGANKDATWQYFGVPVDGCKFTVDYITWLYEWSESEGWLHGWNNEENPVQLEPFKGYAITQYGQPTYDFTGSLIVDKENEVRNIELTYTEGSGLRGDNLFANSYTSPIDVSLVDESDIDDGVTKTFYIFNSGSWNQWNEQTNGGAERSGTGSTDSYAPGQFISIPVRTAAELGEDQLCLIAPMQGVEMYVDEPNPDGSPKHFRLSYEKHVWNAGRLDRTKAQMNNPLRAPKAEDEALPEELRRQFAIWDSISNAQQARIDAITHRVRLVAYGENSGNDRIVIIESPNYAKQYENGADAPKVFAETEGLLGLYTNETECGLMSVNATNSADGMYIGFRAGEDSRYELYASNVIGEPLQLLDLETMQTVDLKDSAKYVFTAMPNSQNDFRFRIINKSISGGDATGWGNADGSQIKIWKYKENLYVAHALANSVAEIYTAAGDLLEQVRFSNHTTIDTSDMPEGVYMVRVRDSVLKFFVKH